MGKVKVIFRYYKETKDVIAIFPELPSDFSGQHCMTYEHVGQHGIGSPHLIINDTRPAKPSEYENLMHELTDKGYDIEICKRYSQMMRRKRQQTAFLNSQG